MKNRIALLLLCYCQLANATSFPIGARNWGMGNATTAVPHTASVFGNPAGLGWQASSFLMASSHTRFAVVGLNNQAVAGHYHQNSFDMGVGAEVFGDKLYSETRATVGLAKRAGNFSLGLSGQYQQTAIEGTGSKGVFLLHMGVMGRLGPNLQVGFHAENVLGARLFKQKLPLILRAGASYQLGKQVLLMADFERHPLFPIALRAGLEYQFYPGFWVRSGIQPAQKQWHGGLGVLRRRWGADYALHTSALGLQHHVTLTYNFSKR